MFALLARIDLSGWPDYVSAIGGALGAVIALFAARSARKDAKASKELAERSLNTQTRPYLTSDEAPIVSEDASGHMTVTFAFVNEGRGHARILSYGVRDDLVQPSKEHDLHYEVLAEDAEAGQGAFAIAPDGRLPFELAITAQTGTWFRKLMSSRRPWAFEVLYTDLNGMQRTCSRFGVEATGEGGGWQVTKPRHTVG